MADYATSKTSEHPSDINQFGMMRNTFHSLYIFDFQKIYAWIFVLGHYLFTAHSFLELAPEKLFTSHF